MARRRTRLHRKQRCKRVFAEISEGLERESLVTFEAARIRIRTLPIIGVR
jgi:hypothetical protein